MDRISADKLAQDMHTVVVDAEGLLKATASDTSERVQKIRARATESLRVARERLRAFSAQVDGKVHEHPWTTAGIAAGAGFLLGVLLARRP